MSKFPDRYCYPAVLTYEDGYDIAVEFPDLEAATSGADDEEALFSARELLGLVLYGMERDGEDIPEPSALKEVPLEENERAVLVDVYMPSIRMAAVNRSVNRTVTLPAWLNAKAMECGINFSQVLQEALKEKLHLA